MKSHEIKKELAQLGQALRTEIEKNGVVRSSEKSGIIYNDLSMWINNRRKWSIEKILMIAGKLGL